MSVNADIALWSIPLIYLIGTIAASINHFRIWQIASSFTLLALVVSIAIIIWSVASAGAFESSFTMVSMVMSLLITFLAWVVTRFSHRYLEGESQQIQYVTSLLVTLTAVSTLVVTHNLAILVAGWAASSFGLHQLLTFYKSRPAAQLVAHKKFLVSRLAEVNLIGALILIYFEVGSFSFAAIASTVDNAGTIGIPLQLAAVLICIAVILKSAQLPLHGWLIQVMEAPTPVSALLHAGIVNIGGFVLIRLSELLSAAAAAQYLLVLVGSLTAVLAGMVMMTRISIKVRLAWSTCAQMGFMLMECGLGLYELAFLHLIAHSLYKAYAFLSSGETVIETQTSDLMKVTHSYSASRLLWLNLLVLPVTLGIVLVVYFVNQLLLAHIHIPDVALFILGIGLAPLFWMPHSQCFSQIIVRLFSVAGLTQIYILWHYAFYQIVPPTITESNWLIAWTGILMTIMYLLQTVITAYPNGKLSTTLYPWAYAGFYLDELFTRATFRVWPVRNDSQNSSSYETALHRSSGEYV